MPLTPGESMPVRSGPAAVAVAATVLLVCLPAAIRPAAAQLHEEDEQVVEVADGIRITVEAEGRIFLEVRPLPGDGYSHFAIRYAENREQWREIRKWNEDPSPVLGRYYRIPIDLLRPAFRYYALRRVFPADRSTPEGWVHMVGEGHFPPEGESLWRIAHWFTGGGERFRELARVNHIPDLIIHSGQEILIPGELLLPLFGRDDQVGGDGSLQFEQDRQGEFARYELMRGEALYSAVVIRYTGRVDADEVNRVAAVIARRSGIDDVTRIPSGFPIKIPKELLAREFLPPGDPDRIEHELLQAEVDSVRQMARSGDLKGVYVILDPGHGGIDVGTMYNGVKERDYVYDIMCRIKRRLETATAATVMVTVRDHDHGFEVTDARKVNRNGGSMILTNPPYRHTDSSYRAVAVNLRWYLANSYYRSLVAKGVDPEKILFTSIHADSLHPAVRGATFYVPGERYRRGTYGHKGGIYTRRREVREKPYVKFSRSQRIRSEGLSRQFSGQLVGSFRKNGIAVHQYQPIRGHVIRKNRKWVPAVIRSNEVPTSILLEVCNLRNPTDNRLLTDPEFRERIARAYVEAVIAHYRG